MDWETVAGQLAQIGLPSLGTLIGNMVLPGIGGGLGASAGKIVASAIASKLGVPPEPQAVSQALTADPDGAKVKLAQIEADSRDHAAELADVQNARSTMVTLAQAGSPLSYGAVVVSILVIVGFLALCTLMLTIPGVRNDAFAQAMFYTLLPVFVSVPAYWLGSSESAKRNADTVRQFAVSAIPGSPPAVARPAQPVVTAGRR